MNKEIKITIDGKEIIAHEGQSIVKAAEENGIFIPTLCHMKDVIPSGTCRICTVKINGRFMTACTSEVRENMVIENNTDEIQELRKIIIETLFVSGNHYCPACEKGGSCMLQAFGYKYRIIIPRFEFQYTEKEIDASSPKLVIDRNRCILCRRCIRTIKNKDGKHYFAIEGRGHNAKIVLDKQLALEMTDEEATRAMENCPVGSILKKEVGFSKAIGSRKYDKVPIDEQF
ncbi:MAG: 2Fe-2S iron-sulfur cluster-binding protein [Saprospiraceae bacterium]